MLFNSHAFIFLFLPLTLLVFFGLGRISTRLAAGGLAAASLFFYGWWNPAYVALLLLSIVWAPSKNENASGYTGVNDMLGPRRVTSSTHPVT